MGENDALGGAGRARCIEQHKGGVLAGAARGLGLHQGPHNCRGARCAPGETTHGMSECSDPVRRDRRAPTDKPMSYTRRAPTQRTMFATISSDTRIDPVPSPH